MKKIILASQSPRRKQLLEWAEIEFDVIVSFVDEVYPPHIPIDEVPVYIAKQKAMAVKSLPVYSHYEAGMPILAADTTVIVDNEILNKPSDRSVAIEYLNRLSGKKHKVVTGVVILSGDKEICFSETTEVVFHDICKEDIEYYVDQYKPFDKAGGYAIQEWIGIIGIKGIYGDFYNVMGLPVSRVVRALHSLQL
jgi:septum formation protein